MALRPCKECQKQISTDAKVCPHCGKTIGSSGGNGCLLSVLGVILLGVIGTVFDKMDKSTCASTPTPTQAEQNAKQVADAKEELKFQLAILGAKQLKDSMRNPDSFKLSQALMMDDGAVCYEYRAQNGFGGMNASQAVLSPKGKFKTSESDGFSSLWNKECAHKRGTDKTWEVGLGAGLHGLLSDN